MKTITPIKTEGLIRKYRGLPENIRVSLFAEETANRMAGIRKKHSVGDEEWGNIVRIVGRTMMALFLVKDFVRNLVEYGGLDQQKASAIAQDINREIFQPVRESLMQVHGLSAEETSQSSTAGQARDPAPEQARYGASKRQETRKETQRPMDVPTSQTRSSPKLAQPHPPVTPKPESKPGSPVQTGPKPLSLEELEKREAGIKEEVEDTPPRPPQPPAPPSPPVMEGVQENTGENPARQELLERLKRDREQRSPLYNAPEKKEESGDNKKEADARSTPRPNSGQASSGQATQTALQQDSGQAWNGRTIDLTKIPPRRKSPKRGGNDYEVEIHEA